jgi:hypothetical protein
LNTSSSKTQREPRRGSVRPVQRLRRNWVPRGLLLRIFYNKPRIEKKTKVVKQLSNVGSLPQQPVSDSTAARHLGFLLLACWQRSSCPCRTRTTQTAFSPRPPVFGLTLVTADARLLGLGEIATRANR